MSDHENISEDQREASQKLKVTYRVLAGIICVCSIPALFAGIFLEKPTPWDNLLSGIFLLIACAWVAIKGRVPNWLSFLNRKI